MSTTVLQKLRVALLLGMSLPALGQPTRTDSSRLAAATRSLTTHYTAALGGELRLYNGPEYVDYVRRNTQGHRYFASSELQLATLVYAGNTYSKVPLRYDLVRDQLVLTAPGGGLQLRLLNEHVTHFTLSGHSFIRLVTDSTSRSPVGTGFYDVLVDGPVQLLAAHRKKLVVRSNAGSVESEITASDTYFVRKGQQYYQVAKAAEILRLFLEHKIALRDYVKNNNLEFGEDQRARALEALIRYQAALADPPAN